MSVRTYRFATVLPLFTTGLIPLSVAFWIQDLALAIGSALLIGGAAGGISMILASIAFHPATRVMDRPSTPAFIIQNKGNQPTDPV